MKLASILAALCVCLPCAHADLLTNGSFESPVLSGTTQTFATGANMGGWTVTGACSANCVTMLTSSYTESWGGQTYFWNSESGNQNLDLTGSGNSLVGGIQQTVTTTVGAGYQLVFYLGNMDNNATGGYYQLASQVQVFINGVSQGTFSNNNNTANHMNWEQFTINFNAASTSTTVAFVNATGAADNEAGLDNVSLNQTSSPVPEPSSWLLLATLAGGVAFMFRHRERLS